MTGKPGEDRMSRTEASRAGMRGNAAMGRSGSAGRPGGMGTQRSVFTSQDGLSKGISVAVGPELARKNAQRAATYNAAARNWNDTAGRSFGNFVNNMAPGGFSMQAPDINRPATFADSTYHLGWNPGSLVGLATGAVLPGSGLITGPLGQMAYTAMGGKNPILTGSGNPENFSTWDAPANQPKPGGVPMPGGGPNNTGGGKAEGGSLLPPIAGNGQMMNPAMPTAPATQPPPLLPPVSQVPGGMMPIPGPNPYSWIKPSWSFSGFR